ncbi:MAG TPA: shikimate dehydrogenase, partial [Limnochordia bacterium]
IPHKVAIMPLLDELTPEARLIGAVNTVQNRAGYLIGHNTDGRGFVRSLREEAGFEAAGKHVVVLGAGGAARAIVAQMMLEGAARITIVNRTPARAQALVRDLQAGLALLKPEGGRVPAFRARAGEGAERPQWTRRASSAAGKAPNVPIDVYRLPTDRDRGPERALLDALQSAHLVVNATPVGMAPNHRVPPILRPEWLSQQSLVCDIVYTPLETSFLTAAKERGCRTLSGLGMLIFQGAVAYELFTGFHPPVDLMRDTLRRYLLRHGGTESAPSGGE